MRSSTYRRLALVIGVFALAALLLSLTPFGRGVLFHLAPLKWTGEAPRLAAMLNLAPGHVVADVGAGNGVMAKEISNVVGPGGRLFLTERTLEQRDRLVSQMRAVPHVEVLEALDDGTNLPDGCCDAIYLRFVWHHLSDRSAFADSLARSLRPGGRLAIIDFPPGAFFHLESDHGVTADQVIGVMTSAGFRLERRDDRWGRAFALVFSHSR